VLIDYSAPQSIAMHPMQANAPCLLLLRQSQSASASRPKVYSYSFTHSPV
jgi:hypothetical protein